MLPHSGKGDAMSNQVCIKEVNTGKISRISKVEAFKKVNTGLYLYVDKTTWKAAGRPK